MKDTIFITNQTGYRLYEKYAKDLPVIDYHCHLPPNEIVEDKPFSDIGEMWMAADHYKWRLMRANGVPEEYVTGGKSYREKFLKFAEIMPLCIGNPVYHWAHIELRKYFGIRDALSAKTAESIYERANEIIRKEKYSPRKLIEMSRVEFIATTDDPKDSLVYHEQLAADKSFRTQVTPTFRPDKMADLWTKDYPNYIKELGNTAGVPIRSFEDFLKAVDQRLNDFRAHGCKIADHGMSELPHVLGSFEQAKAAFEKVLAGGTADAGERAQFMSYLMLALGKQYVKYDMAMQVHTAVVRNQNSRIFEQLGPDSGIDSVGEVIPANAIGRLLDWLDQNDALPKTILYTLNPSNYYVMATMGGNFQGGTAGKIQLGSAWWFCDHKRGIEEQLNIVAETGALGQFIGMLTDSRSFSSYGRHDYFRRILCNLIGIWRDAGEIPDDDEYVKDLIEGVCYYNAKHYFGIV